MSEIYIYRERCVSCVCWWFYNIFVSVTLKDILMIACCFSYVAGGELKQQKGRHKKNESVCRLVQSNYEKWWAKKNGRAFLQFSIMRQETHRERHTESAHKREGEGERASSKETGKRRKCVRENHIFFFFFFKTYNEGNSHIFNDIFPFLVNSTNCKFDRIHLNELKVF